MTQALGLLDGKMKHLIAWGLSLSPLDTELGRLLGGALSTRRCRITVIDPRAHEIAQRVRVQCPHGPTYYGTPDQLYLKPELPMLSTTTAVRLPSKKQARTHLLKALRATSQPLPIRATSQLVPIRAPRP